MMARHQLARELDEAQTKRILVFLDALTGEVSGEYIVKPELPPSAAKGPAADPGTAPADKPAVEPGTEAG